MNSRIGGNTLSEEQQDDVAYSVRHLVEFGPALGFPIQLESHQFPLSADARAENPECREAVTNTVRIRTHVLPAILLIGGEKTGDDRWYEKFVPLADGIFERHLLELKKEENT